MLLLLISLATGPLFRGPAVHEFSAAGIKEKQSDP